MEPTPFDVELPAEVLEDLHARLRSTRWPGPIGDDSWQYGVPQEWLQDMVSYWADEWDWAAEAEAMNRWQHYKVSIGDAPIHYLHAPAADPSAPALVLLHGWPWTFWDFKDTIGPLSRPEDHGADPSQGFNVFVVSLPGFGFSVPLTSAGVDVARVAEVVVTLMTEVLGFDRFAVHGGDWGGLVAAHLAHAHADVLIGAHLGIALVPGVNRRTLSPDIWGADEQWMIERNAEAEPLIRSHLTVHLLDPQTLAYGLSDSPVGTAAWIWERRRNWSDCGGDVERAFAWPLVHDRTPCLAAPTAFAIFPRDVVHAPRALLEERCNLLRYNVMDRGGHFGAPEHPDAVVTDVRAFFHDDLAAGEPARP